MKRNLGIVSSCCSRQGQQTEIETLHMMKDIGFDCFHTGAIDMKTVCDLKNEADKLGLDFEFIHAP